MDAGDDFFSGWSDCGDDRAGATAKDEGNSGGLRAKRASELFVCDDLHQFSFRIAYLTEGWQLRTIDLFAQKLKRRCAKQLTKQVHEGTSNGAGIGENKAGEGSCGRFGKDPF